MPQGRRPASRGTGPPGWHHPCSVSGVAAKLLILEDDEMLRKQLCRLFTGRGFDVRDTSSVAAFLERATAERFDACLLDLWLPDGNGLDAWAAVRGAQGGAVAILMTAHGTPEVEERVTGLAMRALLGKPLDLPMLLAAVGTAASRPDSSC